MSRLRKFLCRLLGCKAFDRRASEIIDMQRVEIDRLQDLLQGYPT